MLLKCVKFSLNLLNLIKVRCNNLPFRLKSFPPLLRYKNRHKILNKFKNISNKQCKEQTNNRFYKGKDLKLSKFRTNNNKSEKQRSNKAKYNKIQSKK